MQLFKNKILVFCLMVLIAPQFGASIREVENEKYIIDKKASVITWKGGMQFVPNDHTGYAYVSKGELTIHNEQLVGGTVDVDMNSLEDDRHESDNDLIEHLKSEDFFNVKKFPTSSFTITKVAPSVNGSTDLTGMLTIKGITLPITFAANVVVKNGVVNASGKVTIDRTKWDVQYGSGKFFANLANDTLSDLIALEIRIVAKRP